MTDDAEVKPHIEITLRLSAEEAQALAGAILDMRHSAARTLRELNELASGLDQFAGGDWTFIDHGAMWALDAALEDRPGALERFITLMGAIRIQAD